MGIELWGSQRKQLSRAPSKKASTSKGNSSRDNKGKATKVPKPYDSSKFVSWKAQELFKTKSSKKPLMEKRIDVNALMGDCPEVYEELIRRKWKVFLQEMEKVNLNMVREFYTNCPEYEDFMCFVRGKMMNFSVEAIRKAYHFPKFIRDEFCGDHFQNIHNKDPYNWTKFINTIYTPERRYND